jgi:hypothetical protein
MPDMVPVRAVRTGGLDFMEVPTQHEALVASLLRERAGYVQRGLPDRAAAVDAELRRIGYQPDDDTKPVRRRSKR